MKLVEQAIFTSSATDCGSEYQVVDRSSGVCEADARELSVWEPSHDSIVNKDAYAESYNFHPLPSGAYCLSRSVPAGWDHGGSQRIYTHCLMVSPEVLGRFVNNPFTIFRIASERGLWRSPDSPAAVLEPFPIPGGGTSVDQALLNQLAIDPGAENMTSLVQTARDSLCLAIVGVEQPELLFAGLFNCLPPECRLEFSFSTGLKFSPHRPFRLIALTDDPAEQLWVAQYPNVTLLKLGDNADQRKIPLDGWSLLIERALSSDHIPFLATEISKRRFDLALDDLPALGLQLLETLDLAERGQEEEEPAEHFEPKPSPLAHAPHEKFEKSMMAKTVVLTKKAPSANLALHSPEILEKLEYLDDLVYGAIAGQADSLEQLQTAWPVLTQELDEELLAESREQYLRYALSIWEECANATAVRNPARAIQALDVLCLIFGDAF